MNDQPLNNLKEESKKKIKQSNRQLKNWKEELVVWSIVINTVIAIIQLLITLIIIAKNK